MFPLLSPITSGFIFLSLSLSCLVSSIHSHIIYLGHASLIRSNCNFTLKCLFNSLNQINSGVQVYKFSSNVCFKAISFALSPVFYPLINPNPVAHIVLLLILMQCFRCEVIWLLSKLIYHKINKWLDMYTVLEFSTTFSHTSWLFAAISPDATHKKSFHFKRPLPLIFFSNLKLIHGCNIDWIVLWLEWHIWNLNYCLHSKMLENKSTSPIQNDLNICICFICLTHFEFRFSCSKYWISVIRTLITFISFCMCFSSFSIQYGRWQHVGRRQHIGNLGFI